MNRNKKEFVLKILIYIIVLIGAFVMVMPFFWMVSNSLKESGDIFTWPPQLVPGSPTLINYYRVLTETPIARYFYNSLIVALAVTFFNLFFDALAGYTFAKRRFPGRDIIFLFILGTLMIPGQVTMIPSFLILKSIPLFGGNSILGVGGSGWLDSYYGLIVPGVASAFGIFLMRQFMLSVPDEILDAARIDGCSEFGLFLKIALPLSKPALASLAIFTFNHSWNSFLWPLIVTRSPEIRTLPLGLALFVGKNSANWNYIFAGSVLATLPILIVFFTSQKQFIKGITLGSMKG